MCRTVNASQVLWFILTWPSKFLYPGQFPFFCLLRDWFYNYMRDYWCYYHTFSIIISLFFWKASVFYLDTSNTILVANTYAWNAFIRISDWYREFRPHSSNGWTSKACLRFADGTDTLNCQQKFHVSMIIVINRKNYGLTITRVHNRTSRDDNASFKAKWVRSRDLSECMLENHQNVKRKI